MGTKKSENFLKVQRAIIWSRSGSSLHGGFWRDKTFKNPFVGGVTIYLSVDLPDSRIRPVVLAVSCVVYR